MIKAKVVVTFEMEYEINPKNYPENLTVEEMIEVDKKNFGEYPFLLLDGAECKTEIVRI